MSENPSSSPSEQLEMYREKQKTIRKAITYGVILIVGALVIFFGGEMIFNPKKGEFIIRKDVLKETKQDKTGSTNGDFTTGELNDEAKEFIKKNKQKINPCSFAGKNYINNELGYLFSVEHPEKWTISYAKENAGAQEFVDNPRKPD